MEPTSGSIKTLAAVAAVAVLAGLGAILYGIAHSDLPRSIGGLGLAVIGLTVISLILIRRWVTNTGQERLLLAASQREAQAEKSRYFACQATLEVEQGRLRRDLETERRSLATRLVTEREAMARYFEEQRATTIAETMEATFMMVHGGKFAPDRNAAGRLIQFPRQHPEPEPERARSREHGVVGP